MGTSAIVSAYRFFFPRDGFLPPRQIPQHRRQLCEEIVYRGFMIWFAAMWIGLFPAIIVTSILFGFAHIYLGAKHVLRTAIIGAVFAGIVVASASLWPAIVIHTMVDLIGGDIGFRATGS